MRFIRSAFVRLGLVATLAAMFFGSSARAAGQTEWLLHSFAANGSQGTAPYGNLVADSAGNLYGTTSQGGTFSHGNVYELIRPVPPKIAWAETTLYSFTGGADGSDPVAGVVFDKVGNLYGTTLVGGTAAQGTVFELMAPATSGGAWVESVLHSFQTATDGSQPYGGVVFDSSGNLYGTTFFTGGGCCGVVFELTPPAIEGGEWTESLLYVFGKGFGSASPRSAPILDAKGNLYGTASAGGHNGGGVLWRLLRPTNPGGVWSYKALYIFGGGPTKYDPTDSYAPWDSPVFRNGDLYGTATSGGQLGFGTVFQLVPISDFRAWCSPASQQSLRPRPGLEPSPTPLLPRLACSASVWVVTAHHG